MHYLKTLQKYPHTKYKYIYTCTLNQEMKKITSWNLVQNCIKSNKRFSQNIIDWCTQIYLVENQTWFKYFFHFMKTNWFLLYISNWWISYFKKEICVVLKGCKRINVSLWKIVSTFKLLEVNAKSKGIQN